MKFSVFGTFFANLAILATASPVIEERQQSNGDGPYAPAGYITHSSLPRHTIYRPNNPANAGPMPVFVWSNGACVADGTSARNFLTQIASYGYLVISQGVPGGKGTSNVQMMQEAVTWAANGANGLFNVNRAKIAVGGYSCGGAETWAFINDNRVSSLGIYNSGGTGLANTIRKPYFIVLGGPSDVAYNNGESDYRNLPSGTPSWKANLNRVGHGGTYYELNGGLFAKVTVRWLALVLRGDASARTYFEGNNALSDGWNNVASKNLNNIPTGGGSPTTTRAGATTTRATTAAQTTPGNSGSCAAMWAQCGGSGWTGPKCCSAGTCKYSNDWYSQCL